VRNTWATLSDTVLLSQCEVDTYRASGPGGQKRNKTSSAVRLRHIPSTLLVIAEESRSQHENKAKALVRLRRAFYLQIRLPVDPPYESHPDWVVATSADGRIHLGRKDVRFFPAVAHALDIIDSTQGRIAEAAARLQVTTANLIQLFEEEPRAWQQLNWLRERHGQKPLKVS
jgi:hypothetical protein